MYFCFCRAGTGRFPAELGLTPQPEASFALQVDSAELGSAPAREPELPLWLLAHASLSTLGVFPIVKSLKACPKARSKDPISNWHASSNRAENDCAPN